MRDSEKKIITVGNLGVGGERGIVINPQGLAPSESATQFKDPIKIFLSMSGTSQLGSLEIHTTREV